MEIKMTTTDTPRTDEEMWTTDYHHELCNVVNTEFAQQLERELAASQAEVERLKVINADMRNFLANSIHNEGFNEEQALKFIYQ